jgi:hypothetical protein
MTMEKEPVWPAPHGCGYRHQGDFTQPIQARHLIQLTLAITWPEREANVLNNFQVAAQVHGRVKARIHPS